MVLLSLSHSLHPPLKPLRFFSQTLHRPNHTVLVFGNSRLGGGKLRVSDDRDMTEMAKMDGFADGQADVVVGNGRIKWGEVEAVVNRMSKWVVSLLFGLAILWKHDAEALWAAMGSVVNVIISRTLKQMLNHQRPLSALRSDPGMPSSHAQSIFYAAIYAVVSLVHWSGYDAFTVTAGALIMICATYLARLRVSQKLHTSSQVVVGSVLGAACGVTWHWLWVSSVQAAFIASIWARIFIVLGSFAFCLGFVIHVMQHWVKDEQ